MDRLARNSVHGLRRLGDASRHGGDHHVDRDGEESGEHGSERVLGTTVLGHLNDLVDDETNNIHPGHRRSEREASNDSVEGLGLELLGNKGDSLHSRLHCK